MSVAWPSVDPEVIGLRGSMDGAAIADLANDLMHAVAGQSFLEWTRLRILAEIYHRLVAPFADDDQRAFDAHARAASQIAMLSGRSQRVAEGELDDVLMLFGELPQVADCLRDGVITAAHLRTVLGRTALVSGRDYAGAVDAEIASALRRPGTLSRWQVRNLCDRIVFRHDPDSVRERRKSAKQQRRVWAEHIDGGMSVLHASMTAENVRVAVARVEALAGSVCKHDPRAAGARRSDAVFALLSGERFECLCDRGEDCDATIPEPAMVQAAEAPVFIHVITEAATLEEPDTDAAAETTTEPTVTRVHTSRPSGLGFMDGYGVISGEHVRELSTRARAIIKPINPAGKPLLSHLPSNPYRPSSAMVLYIRARDGYCTVPGCDKPAFAADADHVHEYDHDNPAAGGRTTAENLATKCRMHHQMKTDGVFLDDQYIDEHGEPDRCSTHATVSRFSGTSNPVTSCSPPCGASSSPTHNHHPHRHPAGGGHHHNSNPSHPPGAETVWQTSTPAVAANGNAIANDASALRRQR
ncbi:hypothetical protein GCM10027169_08780 [Gordonia jinhuaensis]|uniref:DUF222 domain-containing protein n=1 Tax=Gordonia jinhuaensis TaxID=1517702 RepID=A0A916WZJ3_9ACTN|nr:HNH endonuclease signature motif containing protein [Gordonia jinhuaensis]GGB44804.1 hypothetical protein GCM10011489_35330 [Gordonia jinhuaensis]